MIRKIGCRILGGRGHEWDERTLVRWCPTCAVLEVLEPLGGSLNRWIPLDNDNRDCSWMTPAQMKTYSKELAEYLTFFHEGGKVFMTKTRVPDDR